MKIGLTQRIIVYRDKTYDSIEDAWYNYLQEHELIIIANRQDQDFEKLADTIDCLIITGGDSRRARIATENRVTLQMIKRQKPIVGICHGAFYLTRLLGGVVGKLDGHQNTSHSVLYNQVQYPVNSYHRLNIERVHNHAKVLATNEEGFCEAWIDGNIGGVVWHPERMVKPWMPPEIGSLILK
jgi:gamma-glutamyl-gamma-aminobutyrate hydrolase PuuD